MSVFDKLMNEGMHHRDIAGDFDTAIDAYRNAEYRAESATQRADALCQLGVTLRLAERYDEAEGAFIDALGQLDDRASATYARIMRDYGMLALDRATRQWRTNQFSLARDRLEESIAVYRALGDAGEQATSKGFLGRVYLHGGDKKEAVRRMLSTHHVLAKLDNRSNERNNLIWLARASAWYRWRYAARGLRITYGTRRFKEYVVLLLGGERLYARLARR